MISIELIYNLLEGVIKDKGGISIRLKNIFSTPGKEWTNKTRQYVDDYGVEIFTNK